MSLKDLCRDLHPSVVDEQAEFFNRFVESSHRIKEAITLFSGVKTYLDCDMTEEQLSRLKISLVLSDFTSVFPDGKCEGRFGTYWFALKNIPDQPVRSVPYFPENVFLSEDEAKSFQQCDGKALGNPGYFLRFDERVKDFYRQVEPLARSGRLMVRPRPIVFGSGEDLKSQVICDVEPDLPGRDWYGRKLIKIQNSVPLEVNKIRTVDELELGSFFLPYLEGIPFSKLSEILDAEQDCLADFRSSVKEAYVEVQKESAKSVDILNDLIQPATNKIERRFKAISKIHRLRISGAVVSTASLSLVALTSGGTIALVAGILGAGGLGLLVKEYSDYLKDKYDLKEMPMYLLWRLGKGDKNRVNVSIDTPNNSFNPTPR